VTALQVERDVAPDIQGWVTTDDTVDPTRTLVVLSEEHQRARDLAAAATYEDSGFAGWRGRLSDLLHMDRGDLPKPTRETTARIRDIMELIERDDFDVSQLRIFMNDRGALKIYLRQGTRARSVQIADDGIEFTDVDTQALSSFIFTADTWQAAAQALVSA